MKDSILKLLKGNRGYISGEEISRVLGVSRTAVWKYMNALRGEGYVIESSSKKGYRLLETPDVLTPEEIIPLIKTKYIGREFEYFESVGSTNDAARTKAIDGCSDGTVVTAEEQTAGRGRLGRSWAASESLSIAFSMVLRPCIKPGEAAGITLVMGTAVCRALKKTAGVDAGIKWPNDIIAGNRKVCGILTEMNAEIDAVNYIIVGTGINVNVMEFPSEIMSIATSLYIETGRKISRKDVLASVLLEFEGLYDEFKAHGLHNIIDEFKSYSVTLGKHVKVTSINESFEGKAVDITREGLLVVRLENGDERRVIAGDVSVRGLNGYL